jgi:hypothetical protein
MNAGSLRGRLRVAAGTATALIWRIHKVWVSWHWLGHFFTHPVAFRDGRSGPTTIEFKNDTQRSELGFARSQN